MTYAPASASDREGALPKGVFVRGMFLMGLPMALAEDIVANKATTEQVLKFAGSLGPDLNAGGQRRGSAHGT